MVANMEARIDANNEKAEVLLDILVSQKPGQKLTSS
jgi:hypothetical protein